MGRKGYTKPTAKTDEEIAAMANTGVSDANTDLEVAERAGADDKVSAVAAEGAKPKVPTYTADGRTWIDTDPYGLKVEGIYGKGYALMPELPQKHAQARQEPNSADYLTNVIHGPDPSAPPMANLVCVSCGKPATTVPVRTALIDKNTGNLTCDRQTGLPIYRGQFVTNGPDLLKLPVHFGHLGECLYKAPTHRDGEPTGLRVKRDRNGHAMKEFYDDRKTGEKRWKWSLLDAQSFDQATARAAGVRASELAKRATRDAEVAQNQAEARRQAEALGFKVGDTARHNSGGARTNGEIDRGTFAVKLPRGQRRQQRWTEEETN